MDNHSLEIKTCTKCLKEKGLEMFPKRKGRIKQFYYASICKICKKEFEKLRKTKIFLKNKEVPPVILEKLCFTCNQIKKSEFFMRDRSSKDGLSGSCKECIHKKKRIYLDGYIKRETIEVDQKLCPSCKLILKKNDFAQSKYSKNGLNSWCKKCVVKNQTEWIRNNRSQYNERIRGYYQNNSEYRMIKNIRGRILMVIKRGKYKKVGRTNDLLGCCGSKCLEHLESLFWPGMTRENMGKGGWQIDHIVPIESFDKRDPDWQFLCFHYTNLQPLWEEDNCKKQERINWTPDESNRTLPVWWTKRNPGMSLKEAIQKTIQDSSNRHLTNVANVG
jgi:hypothetical protein